jgi:predicted hydrocarbon binding protein
MNGSASAASAESTIAPATAMPAVGGRATADPAAALVGVPRGALRALFTALYGNLGDGAPAVLQEAGFTSGVYEAFRAWAADGAGRVDELAQDEFAAAATAFFEGAGWGRLTLDTTGTLLVVDCEDWAEGNPDAALEYPGCYFSAGMLADFFGRVSDVAVGAMEVECRSAGEGRCRFLVGQIDALQRVYDTIAAGGSYEDAIA